MAVILRYFAGCDLGILKQFFNIIRRAFFHSLAYVYMYNKTNGVFMKILPQMYFWTVKSLLNFGSYPYPESIRIRLGGGLRMRYCRCTGWYVSFD